MAKVAPLEQIPPLPENKPAAFADPLPPHNGEHDAKSRRHGNRRHSGEHRRHSGGNPDKERVGVVQAAVNEYRHFMHWSGWHDSRAAVNIRWFVKGKTFTITTMIALFFALFFADLCIIFQVPTDVVPDTILTLVMVIFALEFFALALSDASYVLSFFFWMDLMGTLSMIFDISYMLGTTAEEAEKLSGQRGQPSDTVVVRAARATKLGARAGRLSRVMKLLRFLPFVNENGTGEGNQDVKMAKVISHQLTNVLSTRVAFLTICIVVVLPIFEMFTYPEEDDSMLAWTQLLAEDAEALYTAQQQANATTIAAARSLFDSELARFANFYSSISYGPFTVCYGQKISEDDFNCQPESVAIDFSSSFTEPRRKGSIRDYSEQHLQTSYDLSTPKQLEAVANVSMICFIILVMCVFGLVTSSSISVIALQPLERMLSVVRDRCKQIFKYTSELQEEESEAGSDEEEYDDCEQASEFVLLERVVAKLAAIAHLSTTKDEPEVKENMTENEVMVLNWTQGPHMQAPVRGNRVSGRHDDGGTSEALDKRSGSLIASSLSSVDENIAEALRTENFNSLSHSKEVKVAVGGYLCFCTAGSGMFVRSTVQDSHLFKFVANCEARYKQNPFHNFAHAIDVEYTVARFMQLAQADMFLPETSQFWVLIAAIGHDLGHLGVNNQYLVETSHELALKYNDRSPLENMHCATLFQVVSDPEANVFAQVEKDQYKEMRKGIINAILHTDVIKHNDMMKELALLYQMNSDAFDEQNLTPEVIEVLQTNMQTTLNAILHCADINNPMKPWELAHRIAYLILDEFFAQGDMEKAAGVPVQMLNDRDKVNVPNSQIGFIEFVIAPAVEAIVHLFPTLDGLAANLADNIEHWLETWVEQTSPTDEAKSKMEVRVGKVAMRCMAVVRDPGEAELGD